MAIGTTIGVAAYATATLLGMSALAAAVPWLITIIQVLGGLYLVYLGIQALRAAITGEGGVTTAKHPDERLSIADVQQGAAR